MNSERITYETSTAAIYELLNEAIKNPKFFIDDIEFKTALKSQSGIAKLQGKWKFQTCTINKREMTLNTLKKHSENLLGNRLENGWNIINELRITAIDAIQNELNNTKKAKRQTRVGLQALIKEQVDSLEKQKEVNFTLLQALSGAMHTIQTVSETSNQELRTDRAQIGLEKLRAIVALNQPPYNIIKIEGNVISLLEVESDE